MSEYTDRIIPGPPMEHRTHAERIAHQYGVTLPDDVADAVFAFGRLCAAASRNPTDVMSERRAAAESTLCRAIATWIPVCQSSPPDSPGDRPGGGGA